MHRSSPKPTLALSFALLFGGLALTGCGSSYSDTCNKVAECEGGNDNDFDACVAGTEGAANAAAAYDCADAFDKLIECAEKTGTCDKQKFKSSCGDQAKALSGCIDAASSRDDSSDVTGNDSSGGSSKQPPSGK